MDALISKAQDLKEAFLKKKKFFECELATELGKQDEKLVELANDQCLQAVVEEARFMRQSQLSAAEAFNKKCTLLVEGELTDFMENPTLLKQDETNILTLQDMVAQITADSDLNVADPVWILFLHVLVNVRTRCMSFTTWSSCCAFINGCRRWNPDERSLTGEIRRALATLQGKPPRAR